jgi:hypothetical protein
MRLAKPTTVRTCLVPFNEVDLSDPYIRIQTSAAELVGARVDTDYLADASSCVPCSLRESRRKVRYRTNRSAR